MQVDRRIQILRKKEDRFVLLMQSVDALAAKAEEGRFKSAKVVGEVTRTCDPAVSEWGNPVRSIGLPRLWRGGNSGN